jgi:Domain of unknown function (DUF4249)
MIKKMKLFFYCLLLLTAFSCKEPFAPPIVSTPASYLVVEAVLNAGNAPTSIRLTRTFKLADSAQLRGELNAQVQVEGKDNTIHPLVSSGNGFYTSPNLGLTLNKEYRLRIRTTGGKEYLSEYVVARETPAIDSLNLNRKADGAQIEVNTHDDGNDTRYYRWDYEETWEIRSYYYSRYKYLGNGIVRERTFSEDVSVCWKYGRSTNIVLGSSARLQSDVIANAPILFIPNNDEKISVRYSILLRQYALDKTAYQFYELMKKNTESLGSVFDAQPSEIRGNVTCVSAPEEVVIGYVTASTISEKRFFVLTSQVQPWRFSETCLSVDVANNPDSLRAFLGAGLSPYEAKYSPAGSITHYMSSDPPCVDCTERGGSTVRPSYW